MRFNPQIMQPDPPPEDDEGNLLLPAGLQSIADQLRTEARQLADRFPADEGSASGSTTQVATSAATKPGTAKTSPGRTLLVRLMPLLALSLLMMAVWKAQSVRHQQVSSQSSANALDPASSEAAAPAPVTHLDARTSPVDADQQGVTRVVHELSGPELEGLLDILEQQGRRKHRISL